MLTTAEFKTRYQISNETFRRARVAAERKAGYAVTQRQGSHTWVILEPDLILAELSLEAKTRGFEAALEAVDAELVPEEKELASVGSALAVATHGNTLALADRKPIEFQVENINLDYALTQVGQDIQDSANLQDSVMQAIEQKTAADVVRARLAGIRRGLGITDEKLVELAMGKNSGESE